MDENLLNHLPKGLKIKEEIKNDILNNRFGKAGKHFLSVRGLAKYARVSLVTAHRIMIMLRDDNLIKFTGNRYVILAKKDNQKTKTLLNRHIKKNLLGLVVTNLENPFFSTLSKEVELAAKKSGLKLMISSSNYDMKRESQILNMFCSAGVAGILSCPGIDPDTYKIYSSLNVPFVFLGRKVENIDADTVLVHNFRGGQLVAKHFISLDYRSFGYIGLIPLKHDPRLNGFRSGLVESGHRLSEDHIIKVDSCNFDSAIPDICQFLKKAAMPIAIFCYHDLLAVRVIKACKEAGLSIPKDVAIAGFDNLPVASEIIPSLTTVSYPLRNMAQLALNRLQEKMQTHIPLKSMTILLEPELISRQTTLNTRTAISNKVVSEYLMYQTV